MGMQAFELAGVAILIVIGVLLLGPWLVSLRRERPGLFVVATVGVAGMLGATLSLILVDDFFPDGLEPVGRVALIIGIVGGGLLLSLREAT
jgi:hypothetical protein